MKTFSHKRPVRNEAGELQGYRPAPVSRVTVARAGDMEAAERLLVSGRRPKAPKAKPERKGPPIRKSSRQLSV